MSTDSPINPNWDAKTQMTDITEGNGKMATNSGKGSTGNSAHVVAIGGGSRVMTPGKNSGASGKVATAMGGADKGSAKPKGAANPFGPKKMSSGQGGAPNSNVRGIVKGGK
jgi:hypothetical protein